tara:strand:- start:14155 stop:14346 length:192 start_codon:yes stop_codon:yes gene_type:complete
LARFVRSQYVAAISILSIQLNFRCKTLFFDKHRKSYRREFCVVRLPIDGLNFEVGTHKVKKLS